MNHSETEIRPVTITPNLAFDQGTHGTPSIASLSKEHTERIQPRRVSAPISQISSGSATAGPGKKTIFLPEEIRNRRDIFVAGRGGETNFHEGNSSVRMRVLEHTSTYASLKTSERGKKFARQLLHENFQDVTFVVRHSYFFKNLGKGNISKEKIESVTKEHGGSLDNLIALTPDHYFTVGETWILGIISDIVRFGAVKLTKNRRKAQSVSKKTKSKRSRTATVSDDERSLRSCNRSKKRVLKNVSEEDSFFQPYYIGSDNSNSHHVISVCAIVQEGRCSPAFVPVCQGKILDHLDELELIQSPLPSEDDDARLCDKKELIDFLGSLDL